LRLALLRVCPGDRAALVTGHARGAGAVVETRFRLHAATAYDALRADGASRIEAARAAVTRQRHAAEAAVAHEPRAALDARNTRRSRGQTHARTTEIVLTNAAAAIGVESALEPIELTRWATTCAVVAASRTTILGRSTERTIRETLREAARERVGITETVATLETVVAWSSIRRTHRVDANAHVAYARATLVVHGATKVVRQAASKAAGARNGITYVGAALEVVDAEVAIGAALEATRERVGIAEARAALEVDHARSAVGEASAEAARVRREITIEAATLGRIVAEEAIGLSLAEAARVGELIAEARATLHIRRAVGAVGLAVAASADAAFAFL